MRYLLMILLLILLFPSSSYAQQTVPDTGQVVLTINEYNQLRKDIRTLLETDSINVEIISNQKAQLLLQQNLILQDSLKMEYQSTHISLLEEENTLFEERVKRLESRGWKDSRGFWAGVGALAVVVGAWVSDLAAGG